MRTTLPRQLSAVVALEAPKLALASMILAGLLLPVPGAIEWLSPSWPDLMTLLCYVGVFFSLIFLVGSIVCPERMSEFASLREDECERAEADMVTCYQCSFRRSVWKRAWLRGDYIGKVLGRCRLCGSEYRVKTIYAVEPKPCESQTNNDLPPWSDALRDGRHRVR